MIERQLLQLPNKDLWRGSVRVEEVVEVIPVPVTVVSTVPELSSLDKAFNQVVLSAAGGPLNCLWCGQQFAETVLRGHLDKNHPSVSHPMNDAEVAMHANAPVVAKAE